METPSSSQLHRQETRNSVGARTGYEFSVPDTSKYQQDNYRTVADEVRQTFDIDLCSGAQKILMQELPAPQREGHTNTNPEDLYKKILMQGPLEGIATGSPQEFLTRTWSCKDTERISQGPFQKLLTGICTRAQGPMQNHAKASDSISYLCPEDLRIRNCEQDVGKIFNARPRKRISPDRQERS